MFWAKNWQEGLIFPELQVINTYRKNEALLAVSLEMYKFTEKTPSKHTYFIGSSFSSGLKFFVCLLKCHSYHI